jgi:hypothetical protein
MYEFKRFVVTQGHDVVQDMEGLNALGREGWHITAAFRSNTADILYLERAVEEED